LLLDPICGVSHFEMDLLEEFKRRRVPYKAVVNKIDQMHADKEEIEHLLKVPVHMVSALTMEGIDVLKEIIAEKTPTDYYNTAIVGDILAPGDMCILVTPIDSAAPRGRLILPQVQTIRDILDHDGQALVVKETELPAAIASLQIPPAIVITDSQVFQEVASIIDESIPLTSFSILFARYKGDLKTLVEGVKAVQNLKNGDKVLIAEACTHHRQEDDIGSVKIPALLKQKLGVDLEIHWYSESGYPEELKQYSLIIHCGACMINRRQMMSRIKMAQEACVPIINYGIFLAYMNGILNRTLQPFRDKGIIKTKSAGYIL